MNITSPSFENNTNIPTDFSCDGREINPEIVFESVPKDAESLVLIMDDPDAPMGVWDHWLVWNIPPTSAGIPEDSLPQGVVGTNTSGEKAYQGPCPPKGEHRYFFRLYALDTMLDLPPESDKETLLDAIEGHVLAEAQLIGKYSR